MVRAKAGLYPMAYKAKTLTGRIALHFGVTKANVRDYFLVGTFAVFGVVGLLVVLK